MLEPWRDRLPVLTGDRVLVREITCLDAQLLFDVISDPAVARYISTPPPSVTAFMGFVEWARRQRAAGQSVCFVVVPRGLDHAIGLFQVRALEPRFRVAEWGFAIAASFWSTGVFEDAARVIADFTFDTLGAHRLEGRAVTVNGRGNGALHKLGASGEALLRGALERDGVCYEQFLWSLTAATWRERRSARQCRFSRAALERRIEDAIRESRRSIWGEMPPHTVDGVDPYPYFIGRRVSPARPAAAEEQAELPSRDEREQE